ncbi:MAG: 16S rRNA (uracil(1498)-N(3))-methyltransferase [Micavibrio sp.]|nr:16S rRNA (uracil(1498)-N(3))-methyltransferase [Micavibrio sp.]
MSNATYKNLLRLYLPVEHFSVDENHALSDGQHHYLKNVMRAEAGEKLRVFNGRDGEWLAEVIELSKKKAIVTLLEKIAEQKSSPDVFILASPVKKEAFDFMVEKASELGAAVFQPITCQHTVVHRVNAERMAAQAAEAAEQCERLDVMAIAPLMPLNDLLASWPRNPALKDRTLLFCQERGAAAPLADVVMGLPKGAKLALLIGPEGGFSETEVEKLLACGFVESVSLGPRILKAETALISALAGVQMLTEK